jgi:glycine cleavage system regulatory protein
MKDITDFESLEHHIKQVKANKIRCHYCEPQEKFTNGMDFIINIDTIQEDFDTLCKKLNVKTTKIEHLNHNNKIKKFCNEELKQLY